MMVIIFYWYWDDPVVINRAINNVLNEADRVDSDTAIKKGASKLSG